MASDRLGAADMAKTKLRTVFVLLNKILKLKSGKKKGPQEEVLTIVRRDDNIDQTISKVAQPQLILV